MSIIRDNGILLKEIQRGENDKQLTILTLESGKITVFAKGAKRPKSKFAAAQALIYSEFVIFNGGRFLSLNQINPLLGFPSIAENYDKYCTACIFMEICDNLLLPEMDSRKGLKILLHSLKALSNPDCVHSPPLVFAVFVFKFLQSEGFAPLLDYNENGDFAFFSAEGLTPFAPNSQTVTLSKCAVSALKYILDADIKSLFCFRVSEDVAKSLGIAAGIFLKNNIDVKINSLELIPWI